MKSCQKMILIEEVVWEDARKVDVDFENNIDNEDVFEELNDMGYARYISDDGDDSHELRDKDFRYDSDEDGNEICSKRRRKKKFKEAVRKYAVKNDLHFNKNTHKNIQVICGPKLKGIKRQDKTYSFWIFSGSISKGLPELVIKTCELEHGACTVVPTVKFCKRICKPIQSRSIYVEEVVSRTGKFKFWAINFTQASDYDKKIGSINELKK
ncbi:hypothetical protein M0R45_009354 [Rubus argutus]|uniref:Transposase n=1 Tax=Rubus argutus TaxID=59490 RepID=A0AAW1Y3F0_RUBAR